MINKKPYVCPVCNGSRFVPLWFYTHESIYWSSNAASEQCKTCNGNGVLWEPEYNTEYHTPKTTDGN